MNHALMYVIPCFSAPLDPLKLFFRSNRALGYLQAVTATYIVVFYLLNYAVIFINLG